MMLDHNKMENMREQMREHGEKPEDKANNNNTGNGLPPGPQVCTVLVILM